MTQRRRRGVVIIGCLLAAGLGAWLYFGETDPSSRTAAEAAAHPQAVGTDVVNALLARAVAAPSGSLRIAGIVRDGEGPVADAILTVTRLEAGERLSDRTCACSDSCGLRLIDCSCGGSVEQLMTLINQRELETEPLARTHSGADGSFVLEGLAAGSYTLWADSPRGSAVIGEVKAGEDSARLDLVANLPLSGQVVDEAGAGVPGARLMAVLADHAREFEVLTSDDGHFSLGALPRGDYIVLAAGDGWVPAHLHSTPEASSDLRLTLLKPRAIAGRVQREGKAVADVAVEARGDHRVLTAKSDATGHFSLSGFRPGTYEVTAKSTEGVGHKEVKVKGDALDVVLELGPAGAIEGTVRDEDGPVAGVEISATSHGNGSAKSKTDGAGHYRLDSLALGEYELRADAKGHQEPELPATRVTGGSAVHLDVMLKKATPVAGVVTDEDGKPVVGASVEATASAATIQASGGDGAAFGSHFGNAMTTDGGLFTVDHLVPGTFDLQVSHADFVPTKDKATAPTQNLRLVLHRGASISGQVIDDESKPVKGARVAAYPDANRRDEPKWGIVDETAHFRVRGLVAGTYAVMAWDDPDATAAQKQASTWGSRRVVCTVTVAEAPVTDVELRLTGNLTLSGQVHDPAGAPLSGASVSASSRAPNAPPPSGETEILSAIATQSSSDSDGGFLIRRLNAGDYYVSGALAGYHTVGAPPRVAAGSDGLVLTLARSAAVRGRVVDSQGAPLTEFRVDRRAFEDPDGGVFQVTRDPPGPYHLIVTAEGYAAVKLEGSVADGEVHDVGDVVMNGGRTIQGVVVAAADGAPIAQASVTASDPSAPLDRSGFGRFTPEMAAAQSASDGSFKLEHVLAGPVRLHVTDETHAPLSRELQDGENQVTLALSSGATVHGVVLDAQKKPIAVRLEVAAVDGSTRRMGQTDATGHYSVSGLPSGRMIINLAANGDEPWSGNQGLAPKYVDVTEGSDATADLLATSSGATVQVTGDSSGLHFGIVRGDIKVPSGMAGLMILYSQLWSPRASEGVKVFDGLPDGTYTVFAIGGTRQPLIGREVVSVSNGTAASVAFQSSDLLPMTIQ